MSRLGLFSTVPRNQMVAIDRNFREFRGYSGSLLVCVCTSIARTCLDLTNGCCRTRLRWRSGTPQSQALSVYMDRSKKDKLQLINRYLYRTLVKMFTPKVSRDFEYLIEDLTESEESFGRKIDNAYEALQSTSR